MNPIFRYTDLDNKNKEANIMKLPLKQPSQIALFVSLALGLSACNDTAQVPPPCG